MAPTRTETTLSLKDGGETREIPAVLTLNPWLRRNMKLRLDGGVLRIELPRSCRGCLSAPEKLIPDGGARLLRICRRLRERKRREDPADPRNLALAAAYRDFAAANRPDDAWLLRRAGELAEELAAAARKYRALIAPETGPGDIRVRLLRSKWGSCSAKGRISFSAALIFLPAECREYVAIHELCHLRRMDHSEKFWRLVEEFCPDCRRRIKIIREESPRVFFFFDEMRRQKAITFGYGPKVLAAARG